MSESIRVEQTTSLPANTGVTWGYINDQAQSIYGAKTFYDNIKQQSTLGAVTLGHDVSNPNVGKLLIDAAGTSWTYLDLDIIADTTAYFYIGRNTSQLLRDQSYIYNYLLQRNIRYGAAAANINVLETWNDNNFATGTDLTGTSSSIALYQRIADASIAGLGRISWSCESTWEANAATRYSGVKLFNIFAGQEVTAMYIPNDGSVAFYGPVIQQTTSAANNCRVVLNQNNATKFTVGYAIERQGDEKWFFGLDTANDDLIIRKNESASEIIINNTTGDVTFQSNVIIGADNLYLGVPNDETVGSWEQLKTGAGLATTYKIQHYEDVSGDGSLYGYDDKFTIDYLGNAIFYASGAGGVYGQLTAGTLTLSKPSVDQHLLIYSSSGKTVISIDQHNASRAYSGIKYLRNGTEKWFAGLNTGDDVYRIWTPSINAFGINANGSVDIVTSIASNSGGISILNSGSSGYPAITLWNGSVGATNSWKIIVFGGNLQIQYFNGSSWINKEIWNPS